MAKSSVLSITVPSDLKLKLDAVVRTGHYDSTSEFIRDCVRSHFRNNKDVRIAIAYELFKLKKISISKAAEMIKESVVEVKLLFKEREI